MFVFKILLLSSLECLKVKNLKYLWRITYTLICIILSKLWIYNIILAFNISKAHYNFFLTQDTKNLLIMLYFALHYTIMLQNDGIVIETDLSYDFYLSSGGQYNIQNLEFLFFATVLPHFRFRLIHIIYSLNFSMMQRSLRKLWKLDSAQTHEKFTRVCYFF